MKRYIAITLAALTVHACTATTAVAGQNPALLTPIKPSLFSIQSKPANLFELIEKQAAEKTLLEQQIAEYEAQKAAEEARHREMVANKSAITQRLNDLEKYVGVTWYVFSGSTPRGWDCSGLTRWFYEGLEIEIPHSANKQSKSGTKVTAPKEGDIVLFDYENNAKAYDHAGIYIGNGKMIHSGGKKGDRTEVADIEAYASGGKVVYIRLLDTP